MISANKVDSDEEGVFVMNIFMKIVKTNIFVLRITFTNKSFTIRLGIYIYLSILILIDFKEWYYLVNFILWQFEIFCGVHYIISLISMVTGTCVLQVNLQIKWASTHIMFPCMTPESLIATDWALYTSVVPAFTLLEHCGNFAVVKTHSYFRNN